MEHQETILSRLESEFTEPEIQWIKTQLDQNPKSRKVGFVMAHRHISGDPVSKGLIRIENTGHSIDLTLWARDQLARAVLLLSLDNGSKDEFYDTIETLLMTADNREAQALYSTIPLFNYPEIWKHRGTEAIRSNVGTIFDAMAFNNPYPARYFDDKAWNQLVLKTIFSNKSIRRITGLAERRNENLAISISDFAHERWAAGRSLPPEVWFLTEPYSSATFWADTRRLLSSDDEGNQIAGYLLWKAQSSHAPDEIRESFQGLLHSFATRDLTWETLSHKDTG